MDSVIFLNSCLIFVVRSRYSLGVMLLLAFYPASIESVENRAVSVEQALQSVAATMDVDVPGLQPLLWQLISRTPSKRCTATALLEHPFFRDMLVPSYLLL